MFYEKQPSQQKENYKSMLAMMGSISNMFSESDCPYLVYRAHENIFCKYLDAVNLGREDCSADAKKGSVGIGLKTWMGQDNQKVAEFNKVRKQYANLTGLDLVKKIAELRNIRIKTTMNIHGLNEMVYHVVKRVPGKMQIFEIPMDCIDIENIVLDANRGNDNNTYFSDGKHTYHFSTSKNTLYMLFNDMQLLDEFSVEIIEDPYDLFWNGIKLPGYENMHSAKDQFINVTKEYEQLCLPLYSVKKGQRVVFERSGLNQWNAAGRPRHADEIYIPYNKKDKVDKPDFFPPRDTPFKLTLPDGTELSAKVCQENGKAIMSNPNKTLGKWLLRDVLELPERTLLTYEMLEAAGIDNVVFTKLSDNEYKVDFGSIGTYERMNNLDEFD